MEDAVGWVVRPARAWGTGAVLPRSRSSLGPSTLASAESTCRSGDTLDLLTRLADRSMVSVRRPASGGARYELLETLREYGRSRMNYHRRAEVFESHAAHFAALAGFVEKEMRTPAPRAAGDRARGGVVGQFARLAALRPRDRRPGRGVRLIICSARRIPMRAIHYELVPRGQTPGAERTVRSGTRSPRCSRESTAYGAWVHGEFELTVALAHETRTLEYAHGVEPSGLTETSTRSATRCSC